MKQRTVAYTRVGPLSLLEWSPQTTRGEVRPAMARTYSALKMQLFMSAAAIAELYWRTIGAFKNVRWGTKKYDVRRGRITDWDSRTTYIVRRVGVPIIAGMAALLIVTQLWQLPANHSDRGGSTVSTNPGDSAQDVSQAATTTNPTGTNSGDTAASWTSNSTNSLGQPTGRATASKPATSSDVYSTTSQASGVPLPYTLTTPSQSLQAGGKQVIGTSPVSITLN